MLKYRLMYVLDDDYDNFMKHIDVFGKNPGEVVGKFNCKFPHDTLLSLRLL